MFALSGLMFEFSVLLFLEHFLDRFLAHFGITSRTVPVSSVSETRVATVLTVASFGFTIVTNLNVRVAVHLDPVFDPQEYLLWYRGQFYFVCLVVIPC